VVRELLELEGIELSQVKVILPPQSSAAFIARLADALHVGPGRCLDVTAPGQDLFTSSLPYTLEDARRRGLAGAGDVGLIIAMGSGLQVGGALYYF
jgi:3-oxoacyl-[acyl-carrier-protein] synthase-3